MTRYVFSETVGRYARALAENGGIWALATAALLVISLPLFLGRAERLPRWVFSVSLVVICGIGIWYAWTLRWIGDDAFISFRYARNLAEGAGLVFNQGARVEGYTNFLWTVLLAGFIALGLDPGQVSIFLSIGCLVGSCVLAARLVGRVLPAGRQVLVPLAALLLATNYTFASYGTSGLETMFAALLLLVALERAEAGALLTSGTAGIAASMAHPDHAIFYVVLGALLVWRSEPLLYFEKFAADRATEPVKQVLRKALRGGRHNLLGYAAPFLLVYVPYFIWRTTYYGDLFPNTYYAKSGSAWYVTQGLSYLGISGITGGIWASVPLALFGVVRYRRTLLGQFTLFAVPLYLFYVVKIGGDFMLGRLLCPVLPLSFMMAELGLRELLAAQKKGRRSLGLAAAPLLALVMVPALVVRPDEKFHHVADERTFYPLVSFDPIEVKSDYTEQAKALEQAFAAASREPVVGIGCVGIVGYETSFPTFDYWGLTEPSVARMKLKRRGRPGHEKLASHGHAAAGNADFADVETFPKPYVEHTELGLGPIRYYLLKYDLELLEPLRDSGAIKLKNFESWVRRWRPGKRQDRLSCDVWFMSQFYFMVNPRERVERTGAAALRLLQKRLPDGFLDWVVYGESPEKSGFSELSRWSFDQALGTGWKRTGRVFLDTPSLEGGPGQGMVYGNEGAFINSYDTSAGDEPAGELRSPKFELQGDAITLRVGGGMSKQRLTVQLMVEDEVVETLTGCQSELMYRWAWDTREHRGRAARIVIQDYATGGWGHIMVDEIVQWQRTTTADRR